MQVAQQYREFVPDDFDETLIHFSKSEVLYKDEDCECRIDLYNGHYDKPFIHFYTNKWSRDKYKKYKKLFSEVIEELKSRNISCIFAKGNTKFASKFGFNHFIDYGGDEYYILEVR